MKRLHEEAHNLRESSYEHICSGIEMFENTGFSLNFIQNLVFSNLIS